MRSTTEQDELLKREQGARSEAEAAGSRLSLLSEASRVLGSSLDYESALGKLAAQRSAA